ncbi:hypothetical protein Gorai_014480, partial [Gossypium raimondii]|nr:hypothetical protein [Gossypium raimondii]
HISGRAKPGPRRRAKNFFKPVPAHGQVYLTRTEDVNNQLVFFMETKLNGRRMEAIKRKCGFILRIEVGANGSRESLYLAWKEDASITLRSFSMNHDRSDSWRLMTQTNSLVAKSIWSAKMVLSEGIDWRVGTGENISIVNHTWIPDSINYKLSNEIRTKTYLFVVDLINSKTREWRRDQILDTFSRADADRILRIPLASTPHEDMLI